MMTTVTTPDLILFSQHGMIDSNQGMAGLAYSLNLPNAHVVAPDLGIINTLFTLEPLIQTIECIAKETFSQLPNSPARVIAHSLGGIVWVEALVRHYEWWPRIESLVLLGSPLGGADLARIVDPFGWGIGIAKYLGENRRSLAEDIASVIPTLVVAGNTTRGGDNTVTIESTKLNHAHFKLLDGIDHNELKHHPAVIKVIQEFWSEPRSPLPIPDSSLLSDLIDYFRAVPGITDASRHGFLEAKTILTFLDGTSIRTWTNLVGVQHVFVANANDICEYAGFVGWVHVEDLEQALQKLLNRFSYNV